MENKATVSIDEDEQVVDIDAMLQAAWDDARLAMVEANVRESEGYESGLREGIRAGIAAERERLARLG